MPPSSRSAPMMYAIQISDEPLELFEASFGVTGGPPGPAFSPGADCAALGGALATVGDGVALGVCGGAATLPTENWAPAVASSVKPSPPRSPPVRPLIVTPRWTCVGRVWLSNESWYEKVVEPPDGSGWPRRKRPSVADSMPLRRLTRMVSHDPSWDRRFNVIWLPLRLLPENDSKTMNEPIESWLEL